MNDDSLQVSHRDDLFRMPRERRLILWLVGITTALLLAWTMRAMAPVAVPVVFAILATLFVAPMDLFLRGVLPKRLKWLAHLLAVFALLAGFMVLVGAIIYAAQQVLSVLPNFSEQLTQLMPDDGQETDNGGIGTTAREIWNQTGSMLGARAIEIVGTVAENAAKATGAFTTSVLLILFVVFMALSELADWQGKMRSIWSSPSQKAWRDSLTTISRRLRQFLLIRSAVGVLQAALYVGWLALFGIDLLPVWAVLTFVLTYIPTLGSIIAGTIPVLYALMTVDPLTVLAIAAGLFLIEQVVGNYIDPVLLGQKLVLSPLVILVALLFWSWYWGVAGAFLATPIMLTLLVVMNHVPPLRPFALFISNQTSSEALDEALDD